MATTWSSTGSYATSSPLAIPSTGKTPNDVNKLVQDAIDGDETFEGPTGGMNAVTVIPTERAAFVRLDQ